jgi:membrane protease YdiL (CAAX protease family)
VSFLGRLSALMWFLVASAWFLFSDLVASGAAAAVNAGDFQEPLYRILLLFLLIVGYWIMSRLGQRRMDAGNATALVPRPGWGKEFALGTALGWAGVLACVLPVALIGGLVLTTFTNAHQYVILFLDLIALAAGTLAIEIAFRGYPFLRLVEAMGPGLAAFFMAVVYAIWRTHAGATTTASVLVSFFLGMVLAVAVLRTRALWVGWGFHFAWIATMSMLFGLPVSGPMSYSPVIATNANGPAWLSGGGQGPEGSAFAVLVSFLLLFAMVRVTGDLKHKYGYSEIVPGGIPADIDAAARMQHEAAMGSGEPEQPALVQILPAEPATPAPPPPAPPEEAHREE